MPSSDESSGAMTEQPASNSRMSTPQGEKTVVFAMEWVPQYRVPFYSRVREVAGERGINVSLVHGDPPASRRGRNDSKVVPWADYVPNKLWRVRGLELTAQPIIGRLRGADLVILQQETGLLINYPMLAASRLGGPMVALWGHGHNFNPLEANPTAEGVKKRVTRFADWIFAYTDRSRQVFESIGVDPSRITVVQNSTDTKDLQTPTEAPSAEVAELVGRLKAERRRVGWIVSALDRWKRVPFLLEVLDLVAERRQDFEFVALGAGDDADILANASSSRPWLHALGARFGSDKAAVGEVAELTIHPGLAGLHVVESFATRSPMVTEDLAYHSHEVEYLSGDNSLVLARDASALEYADAVDKLFDDRARLALLQDGCSTAAERYTVEQMVENFAAGIEAALELRRGVRRD